MKRSFLLFVVYLLCGTVQAEYVPNTMWPYIYEDFLPGELVMKNGDKVRASFNIHLQEGELHYLNGDKILHVIASRVKEVTIGKDRYIPAEGRMMKVIAQEGNNFLLKCVLGDFNALFTGTGAYGASANTQAVRNLSSIEIGGKNIVNHAVLLQNKEGGKELPIVEKLYFFIGEMCVSAHKKNVEKSFPIKQDEWKTFLKANKIKWRKEEDLVKVLHFLNDW